MNILPYFVYWLMSTDLSYDVDTCENNISKDTGFCLSEWQCGFAKGKTIGFCDNGQSGAICCKILLKYFDKTYYLSSLFIKKSQSDTTEKWKIFSADEHSSFKTQYQNTSLSSESKQRLTVIGPAKRNPQATQIIFPVSIKPKVSIDNSQVQYNQSSDADIRYIFTLERSNSYVYINIRKKDKDFESPSVSDVSHDREQKVSFKEPLVFQINEVLFHEMLQHVQTNWTFEVQILFKRDGSHGKRNPVKTDAVHEARTEPARNKRKPVQTDVTHDIQKPVQTGATHGMRRPFQREATHDMRKPVLNNATHDVSKPVERESTHGRLKPVQTDATHNPKQRGATHDMRRPVTLEESHDLRWPVIEEESHDLRNSESETDIFKSSSLVNKLVEMINAYKITETKRNNSISEKYVLNNTSHDRFLKCRKDILYMNESSNIEPFKLKNDSMETKYSDLWINASAVCGAHSGKLEKSPNVRMQEKWPWMVAVQEYFFGRYWYKCGASLLNSYWVVTAAHCVDMKPKWDFVLKLENQTKVHENEHDHFVQILVDEIVVHPNFNRVDLEHDIALLRMESPVKFQPDISPICLPWNMGNLEGRRVVVLGWKLISKKIISSNHSEDVTVPVITSRECEVVYSTGKNKARISHTFICENVNGGKLDFCDGDSGGPLTVLDTEGRWSLIGLVSWGSMCTTSEYPGVYIRISSYAQWITDVINCYESLM